MGDAHPPKANTNMAVSADPDDNATKDEGSLAKSGSIFPEIVPNKQ